MKIEKIDIKVNEEALKAIEELGLELLEDIGNAIEDRAKDEVPIDHGDLRDNIQNFGVDESNKEVQVGVTLEYGKFVELGTVHQAPQPFLRPALENIISEVDKGVKP